MGTWGTGILENDVAQDVKNEYIDLLKGGFSDGDAFSLIRDNFLEAHNDEQDRISFLLALADVLWDYGRLDAAVKNQAIKLIDSGGDLPTWETQNPALVPERKKALSNLKSKLLSPQPKRKTVRRKRAYKCPWITGDVFAYPFETTMAKEVGFDGGYLIIQKITEGKWYPNHITPIVRVKLCVDRDPPKSTEEFDELPYIQISLTRYEERFYPIDGSRYEEDIAEKSLLTYTTDEFGFLPKYLLEIITTSEKDIPPALEYLGCFPNAAPPEIEFIPRSNGKISNTVSVEWKSFEEFVLTRYRMHNLREGSVYQQSI